VAHNVQASYKKLVEIGLSVPCGAAADPVGHALLLFLHYVLCDETSAVIQWRLPRQHHRVVVDRIDVEEARRIGNVCKHTVMYRYD